MSATAREVLLAAAALIEPEGAWTQNAFALDGNGGVLSASEVAKLEATCWCMHGAILHACDVADVGRAAKERAMEAVAEALVLPTWVYMEEWNDTTGRTQAEVVAALRAAAELVQS